MRYSVLLQERRGAAWIKDAELILGGPENLDLARKAGWLKPIIEKKRMTRFDYNQCLACWDRIVIEGIEALEEAATKSNS